MARSKPLADKTRARIAAGIARYWWPLILEAAGHTYDAADPRHPAYGDPNAYYRAWPANDPLRALHGTLSKGLAVPMEGRDGKTTQPMIEALRTMTTLTANDTSKALIQPFIAELRGGGSDARSADEALATITAGGNHHGLVVPAGGTWNDEARTTADPHRAFTTRDAYAPSPRTTAAARKRCPSTSRSAPWPPATTTPSSCATTPAARKCSRPRWSTCER